MIEMDTSILEYLSHSRLETFRTCSLQFRFKYIDRLVPAFVPEALAFGAAFHRAVEEGLVLILAGEVPEIDGLLEVFASQLDKLAEEAPIRYGVNHSRESLLDQARRMLTAWASWPRPAGARILAVEHEFKILIAEHLPPLVGRVDLVEEHSDFVAIIDLKTSRSRYSIEDLKLREGQLVLYEAGVQDLVRGTGKPIRLGIEVISKAKAPTVERLYLDDTRAESLARQIRTSTIALEAVERGSFFPSPSWACATCPWAGPCLEW